MSIFRKSRFVCGASVTGPSHRLRNIPNQDSFLIMTEKYRLLAVSDGMGTKPFADIGSRAACMAAAFETERFMQGRKNIPLEQFLSNIVRTWKLFVHPHDPKECSATCLFLLATKHRIFTARLGDGMICLLGVKPEESVLLSDPKDSEFSNVTFSLSDRAAVQDFSCSVYERSNFKGAVLTTDGISSDLQAGMEVPFAEDLFSEVKKLHLKKREPFLRNLMTNWPVPHHTDDKTIIVAGL
ncbi:protein phosphatase 2C domain-containing protein [bacterium]|nr:protein phosphatase 2C domain-containing protein [bacterium]